MSAITRLGLFRALELLARRPASTLPFGFTALQPVSERPCKPKLTVIIPARDEESDISALLADIREQTDAPPFEVIVADGGSLDDTRAIAAAYEATVIGGAPRALAETPAPAHRQHGATPRTIAGGSLRAPYRRRGKGAGHRPRRRLD